MGRTLYANDYDDNRRLVYLWLVDATDGITPETGEASGQPKISKNGGSFANTTNTLVAHDATTGLYKLQLTSSEVSDVGSLRLLYKSAATAVFSDEFAVEPCPYLHHGTAQAGTTSTITLASTSSGTDNNAYDHAVVWIYAGTGAGQMRGVSSYVASTHVVTVDQDWATTPDSTSKYFVLPSPQPVSATDFADALLARNLEGGSSTGRTVSEALYALRNKVAMSSITGTTATVTVYKTDDSTASHTMAATLTSGTNPITGVDPA